MLVHGLGRDANGERYADLALPQILIQPNWLQMLTPLPSLSHGSSSDRMPVVTDETGGANKRKLRRENEALKAAAQPEGCTHSEFQDNCNFGKSQGQG
eukprot:6488623-Amphidinium_carterae.1